MLNRSSFTSSPWHSRPFTIHCHLLCVYLSCATCFDSVCCCWCGNLKQRGFGVCQCKTHFCPHHTLYDKPTFMPETKQNGFMRLKSCVQFEPNHHHRIMEHGMFEIQLTCNVNLSISNNFSLGLNQQSLVDSVDNTEFRQLMKKGGGFFLVERDDFFDHGRARREGGSIIPTSLLCSLYI